MPAIAFVSCQKPDGNLPIQKVVEFGCTELHMIGDYFYNDGAVMTINGVTSVICKYGDANNTVAKCVERFTYAYGRTGRPAYQALYQYADAGAINVYGMEDDHDAAWNNNDFKLATFKGAFNVAAGTSTTDALTEDDVLVQWRIAVTAARTIRAAYFKNQISATGNGDIPSEMIGVSGVTANDFPMRYYIVDYDQNLKPMQTVVGARATLAPGAALRVIVPDCKSYTDPADKTDNSSKTMLGLTQEAWLRQAIQDGQGAQAGVTIAWTKDIFNRDNGDGGVGFRTYFDTLLAWIETNNYAVDHITGDRHNPHAGIARTQLGASYNATTLCCCPSGQGTGGLTQYPENIMSYSANDAAVIGTLELDMGSRTKFLIMRDAFSWEPLVEISLKFGERVPSLPVVSAKQFNYKAQPAANRIAYAAAGSYIWPASGAAFTNTGSVPLSVAVAATMTAATVSTDGGSNFDNAFQDGGGGYWILPPAGQLKLTYSAITAFVTCPLW